MNTVVVKETKVKIVQVAAQGPSGPQGPPGETGGDTGRVTQSYVAGTDISGHRIVIVNEGLATYASADNVAAAYQVAGISTHAAALGDDIQILTAGPIEDVSFSFVPDLPVFLGVNGVLTQTMNYAWAFRMIVGYATGANSLLIRLGEPVLL